MGYFTSQHLTHSSREAEERREGGGGRGEAALKKAAGNGINRTNQTVSFGVMRKARLASDQRSCLLRTHEFSDFLGDHLWCRREHKFRLLLSPKLPLLLKNRQAHREGQPALRRPPLQRPHPFICTDGQRRTH